MKASQVSACLVTRGDCDLSPILESLPFGEVVIWNNSAMPDLGIWGRYAAIGLASKPVIYTQDDDLLVGNIEELLEAYEPGVVTCSYPKPWDIPWVARGGLFDRDLPAKAFAKYLTQYPADDYFTHWACDGIFTLLSEQVKVIEPSTPSVDLPHAFEGERVSTAPGWYDSKRPLIQQRCLGLVGSRL